MGKRHLQKDLKEVRADAWDFVGERILSRGSSKDEGPRVGIQLVCVQNRRKQSSWPREAGA